MVFYTFVCIFMHSPTFIYTYTSLQRSASLRSSLGDYLDDYGSGPQDAAAADGINL